MGLRSLLSRKKKLSSLKITTPLQSTCSSPLVLIQPNNKGSSVAEIEEIFKRFDVNGDGKISSSELGSMMASLAGHTPTEEELERMMKEVDSDGDGFIDLDEFIELNTKGVDYEKHLEDVKMAFSILDADGDGSISPHELQRVLRSLGDNASLEECRKMIGAVDCDGDGHISLEEFKKMMIRGSAPWDNVLQRSESV